MQKYMQKNVSRLPLMVALVVAVFLIAGCTSVVKKPGTPAPSVNTNESKAMEDTANGALVPTGETKTFAVVGKNFSYDVKEIRVKKGDTVKIDFKNDEGFHDWVLDDFNARTKQFQAGGSESIQFVADKTGTFEYYCSVGQHRKFGMIGKLIVE